MKSTREQLQKRGKASDADVSSMATKTMTELLDLLVGEDAHIRSAAAINLRQFTDRVCESLLLQLTVEEALYSRIAICESLAAGTIVTAGKMVNYLGSIGNNQYSKLPGQVSAKKSFPLPRDIVARYLGRMDASVYPALRKVLEGNCMKQRYEALDAIGYLVFHNPHLATDEICNYLIAQTNEYPFDEMLRWKVTLCLSVFPLPEAVSFLSKMTDLPSVIGREARRSLQLISRYTI